MAVPTYTTDLQLFRDLETAVTFGEWSGFTSGRGQAIDTDYPIQGNSMISTIMNSTGNAGCAIDFGSNITWTSGWNMFMWEIWLAPSTIDTRANGGLTFCIGDDISNYREWNTAGSDFGAYPYGGWQNFAVNPQVAASTTVGTPGTAYRWVGANVRVLSAVSKGSPLGIDVIRYGRGEIRIAGGQTGNYATFSGMATYNDNNINRFGLFQKIDGGYKWKGLMTIGFGALSEFVDSNKSIIIDESLFVISSFNQIDIRNASSIVTWDNITITSLSSVSKGSISVIDNATVGFTTCTFIDMNTFSFLSNSTILSTTFRRCGLITQGGSTFTGCDIVNATGTIALTTTTPNLISECNFTSDGTGHAIEITATGTYTFSKNTFTNYAITNGTTGNESIYNNSGGLVTINVTDGLSPTYRNAGASTTVINNNVSITFTGLKDNTEVRIFSVGTTTELAGIENATTGTTDNRSFTFSLSAGTIIDYRIHNIAYEIIEIYSYTLPSTATSLPFQQRADRWYNA